MANIKFFQILALLDFHNFGIAATFRETPNLEEKHNSHVHVVYHWNYNIDKIGLNMIYSHL